jgi:hypothetical protein
MMSLQMYKTCACDRLLFKMGYLCKSIIFDNQFLADVKTNKKITGFIIVLAFCFVTIFGSFELLKAAIVLEKATFSLSGGKIISFQEKLKYQYVGAEECASVCHNNEKMGFQYEIMKNSPHSKAFEILVSKKAYRYAKRAVIKENPQESSACLKCHVTGAGLDTSYFASSYKKEDGVTCEACHKSEFVTKAFLPKETDCIKCHNDSVHKIAKFDFVVECAKIAHPRPIAKI